MPHKLMWWFYTDITVLPLPSIALFILLDTFCIIRMEWIIYVLVHIYRSHYTVILIEVKVINFAAADCFDFITFRTCEVWITPCSWISVWDCLDLKYWHWLEKNFLLYFRNFHANLKILIFKNKFIVACFLWPLYSLSFFLLGFTNEWHLQRLSC